ncbi:polyphosphate:nucleotide phosphotransferase, PPK2 family [Emticicia oligotrophica DSM 17448]|uniref:Polyphosphate:nucleotide phosphotransferase, PPK2 family n=1 Tax=Emticicia oligotrophica (strain DSM 17448 / CIP 109782 / MTCC 6937 / GPTSA100-15) TaxID=929562 RepID=A0ABN4AN19_EMTOG|nr:polyphosphate kinase 2 family protein [Emticicia oligotrophica]AFK03078.1 polyphosphate:nucleotide phosphotransferase, PPK2 family [Emticicia oligotrophica DSM 17448]
MKKIDIDHFRFDGKGKFSIKKAATKVSDYYEDKEDYENALKSLQAELDSLQEMMYAHNKYGLLVIFQAMDAAGKDGTLKAVFSGVNPQGMRFYSFKRPSETELDHDFLWRTNLQLPERGTITVFNRSYYEEVLVVKAHPEILLKNQRIPSEYTKDLSDVWKNRYEDISNLEKYLNRNGIHVVKFFLHVSKKEQSERLIERIKDPTKNWKFEEQDVKEREFWDDYQNAYEDAINDTSSKDCPWYIIPADDKKNMRLIVANILVHKLMSLDIEFPKSDLARQEFLFSLIDTIKQQDSI